MGTTEWASSYRRLSSKSSALPGRYNIELTPYLVDIHAALDDPQIERIVCMKSAQIAWTDGVMNNYIGRRIHLDPCPMIVMFPKEDAARQYAQEKFIPMVEVTPELSGLVDVSTSRKADNRQLFKNFSGGFLKLVGSNSASSVKSTPAPVVMVEEPDDCNVNIKGQGDTLVLLEERTKTFLRRKIIMGGTPTIEGISRIEAAYKASDQRKFFVPCHACGESHVLAWENVRWLENPELQHEVFGKIDFASVGYACPQCGVLWSNAEKNSNVRRGSWKATAPFHGTAGFYINELYSQFPGSSLVELVKKFLAAKHAFDQGDDTKLRAFRNSSEGLPYAYASELPGADELSARAEEYAEGSVPWGGVVISVGVDVQHDRLAVIARAWGRGEESWLVYWGEIHGQTIIAEQGAWVDLDALINKGFRHVNGAVMRVAAVSIDSSDGQTTDAVYQFVRKRQNRGFMAVKGASNDDGREIFSPPKTSVDTNYAQKAVKYGGLKPYLVGTQRAKDLLLGYDASAGRIRLTGSGPGRMHAYRDVRADYWEQILSEVKVPHRTLRNKKVWQKKAGVRNEALDCEVYALHAARSLKLHLWNERRWEMEEQRFKQAELLGELGDVLQPLAGSKPAVKKSSYLL